MGAIKYQTSIPPDKTIGIYCVSHSKEGMIDVSSKRCLEDEMQ